MIRTMKVHPAQADVTRQFRRSASVPGPGTGPNMVNHTGKLIALALLCMVVEGCARMADGTTVGKMLDEVFDRNMLALAAPADAPVVHLDDPKSAVNAMAQSISDTAILSTLEVSDAAVSASIQKELK